MTLSVLLEQHEDLIICDLAEYYHIYNYENYDPLYIATLVCGLRGSSRLIRELSGVKYTEEEIIRAKIADNLSWLVWFKTKDAEHNRNKPKMLVEMMVGTNKEESFEHDVFDSVEEFKKAREKALRR